MLFIPGALSSIASLMRLPALATFFAGLFGQLIGWLAQYVTRRMAVTTTAITALVALAATMTFTLNTIANAISVSVPPELSQGISMFMPDNAIPCLSAVASARLIRWAWEWQFYAVDKVTS